MKLDSITKMKDVVKKHSPEILLGAGIAGMIAQTMMVRNPSRVYLNLYKATGDESYLVKYYRLTKSNNWLKMHGYPMRRRTH